MPITKHRTFASFAFLLIPLFLAACQASIPQKAPPQAASQIKTIGLVTSIGNEFTYFNFGLTVFSNDAKKTNVEAWRIDDFVAERATALLSKRYELKPVTYNRHAFESVDDIALGEVRGRLYGNARPLGQIMRESVSGPAVDAYVVITKNVETYANQPMVGLGIVDASGALVSNIKFHTLYRITLVDGRSFAEIASADAQSHVRLGFNPLDFGQTYPLRGPFKEVDQSWLPKAAHFETGPLGDKMRSAAMELIDRSLTGTLTDVGLLN